MPHLTGDVLSGQPMRSQERANEVLGVSLGLLVDLIDR